MKLNQKVKLIRESKKISQIYLAHELGLNQSQYSRREKGEIQFNSDEIIKLSNLLETSISSLFDEQQNIISHKWDYNNINSISSKLIEQYEHRLKEKDEMIKLLLKTK
ncbi:helix-turn-helix domain-containing protein [Flavobacterium limi]|uniref:HTH cro/C1-type domain-containing protein n=1 Tax=Flavobacterium limi TaxID=2045105 RepID=A0ABQ1UKN4_9FLAO|nr:helix-turn-helix transcriptional regulator [Flavobacterium limi]GGF19064.1 hypothetical protein GCM10011518_30590 [Flavobacterium limi]